MPLANPYRQRIKDTAHLNGELIHESETVFTSGRVSWSGNQRRRVTGLMPPTTCSSAVVWNNVSEYSGIFPGGVVRKGSLTWAYPGSGFTGFRDFGPKSSDESAVISRAVRSFSTNTGFAESVAESPSALRLIGKRTSVLVNLFRIAGKGKFRQAGELLRSQTGYNVSNRSVKRLERKFKEAKSYDSRRASAFWLEYHFAIVPLLQTVFDSVEQLRSGYDTRRKTASQNGATYGLYAGVSSPGVENLSRLGLLNPASLAWDLLPFSFVIDWFLPIGTILRWIGAKRDVGKIYAWSAKTSGWDEYFRGVKRLKRTNYLRLALRAPSISSIWSSSSNSHGLWTVLTTLALFDGLR